MSQTIKKELLVQLQHLRTAAKDIGRIYVANLQRDIVQMIDLLNEDGLFNNSRKTSYTLAQLKDELDGIVVKPEKGRRKDLKRIEQVVRSMRKIVSDNDKK